MTSQDQDTERKWGPVETVAKAIYEQRNGLGAMPWSRRDGAHKKPYRSDAQAAIDALKPHFLPQFFEALKAEKAEASTPGKAPIL